MPFMAIWIGCLGVLFCLTFDWGGVGCVGGAGCGCEAMVMVLFAVCAWVFGLGGWEGIGLGVLGRLVGMFCCGFSDLWWKDEPESLILAQSERWRHA